MTSIVFLILRELMGELIVDLKPELEVRGEVIIHVELVGRLFLDASLSVNPFNLNYHFDFIVNLR